MYIPEIAAHLLLRSLNERVGVPTPWSYKSCGRPHCSRIRSEMVNPLFILHILALFAAARAMAISPNDATVTDWRESSLDDIPVNSPRFIDPAIVLPVPTSNERVVLAAFSANSAIAKATCTLGETASCINISVLAVLSTFLGLFQATSNGPIVELGGGSTLTLAHPQWQPTADCRLGCQLRAGVADGEWRLFAHLVIDGAQHALHSFRSGSTNGLKAIPVQATAGASTERRSDVYDAGGIVAAYFWDNGNQQA